MNKQAENLNVTGSNSAKVEVNVDQLFSHVECLLKDQHGKGGLTASAKATIDRYLNKIVANKDSQKSPDE
ncbi:hypothetical protein [Colwellia piezophila]|uniref:hypothetical protein n=1 Tax=Colwellia piezophila TaxID=211668 RepID=UPI00036BA47F|nr:hypothetical protein [Colwellia piezophila]